MVFVCFLDLDFWVLEMIWMVKQSISNHLELQMTFWNKIPKTDNCAARIKISIAFFFFIFKMRFPSIWSAKVHIFWEGHKMLRNLPLILLTVCTVVKSKGNILKNFVAFSEYMNFTEWESRGMSAAQLKLRSKLQTLPTILDDLAKGTFL